MSKQRFFDVYTRVERLHGNEPTVREMEIAYLRYAKIYGIVVPK